MSKVDLATIPINDLLQEVRQRDIHDFDMDGIVDTEDVMSHSLCVKYAEEYMRKRADVVLPEFFCHNSELPDVIAFTARESTVIECKVSRSDFLRDKNKPFRINTNQGMGDYRFYCAPQGLIKAEELPYGWGLIEILPSGKIRKSRDSYGNHKKNIDAEHYLLFYYARRAYYAGVHKTILEYRGYDG
ncbi:hypothetical protein UFOVP585_59 [uncultured Caudovirales phage]|uniref:Uncharacterized protein n=1 Tax=uncultured Caudovirales phage TaxID=2100421 RepID=A0A6J5N4H5_9CAUD|nr:hypothetical protein UFOVP585_59 [uncultured Caudovirales phage]